MINKIKAMIFMILVCGCMDNVFCDVASIKGKCADAKEVLKVFLLGDNPSRGALSADEQILRDSVRNDFRGHAHCDPSNSHPSDADQFLVDFDTVARAFIEGNGFFVDGGGSIVANGSNGYNYVNWRSDLECRSKEPGVAPRAARQIQGKTDRVMFRFKALDGATGTAGRHSEGSFYPDRVQ
jgi:hypothetical protein